MNAEETRAFIESLRMDIARALYRVAGVTQQFSSFTEERAFINAGLELAKLEPLSQNEYYALMN